MVALLTSPVHAKEEGEAYWSSIPYLDTVTTPGLSVEIPTSTTLYLTLKECVRIALESNFNLINARRDLDIQDSFERETKAFFIPFVELIGTLGYGKDRTRGAALERIETNNDRQEGRIVLGQNLPTGGRVGVFTGVERVFRDTQPSIYSTEVGATLSQPLLRSGGFAVGLASLRNEELNTLNEHISLGIDERDLALNVLRRYFNILQAKLEIKVSRDALAEKERFLEETQMKFELDEVAESEVSRAEIQFLQERERYNRNLQSYSDRIEDLLILMGLPLMTELEIEDMTDSLIAMDLVNLPSVDEYIRESQVLRPELRQRDIAIQKSKITLQLSRNTLLPSLDFNAETRSYQSDPYFEETRNLDMNTWSADITLSIPLPNIARREAYRRALINHEKLQTSRKAAERDIEREVKGAYRSIKTNEANIAILLKTVEQARKSLDQEKARFEFGLNTSVDVRLAQDDLFEAQSRYYTAIINHQILIAELYRSIGRPVY